MNYKKLNDYELVYQVRESDGMAYDLIFSKYSHLIDVMAKKNLRKNSNIGLEYDDLYQEGMFGISKAIESYNPCDTLFYTYALLCAKREMDRIVKTARRNKHMVLNDAVSLNKPVNKDEDIFLDELISSDYYVDEECYSRYKYNYLISFKYELSFEDSLVYELKINDFTPREIATLLDVTYKNVDYRLHKIRKKLKLFLSKSKNVVE